MTNKFRELLDWESDIEKAIDYFTGTCESDIHWKNKFKFSFERQTYKNLKERIGYQKLAIQSLTEQQERDKGWCNRCMDFTISNGVSKFHTINSENDNYCRTCGRKLGGE